MITKEQCADYINTNIDSLLTAEEIETLKKSIKDQGTVKDILCNTLTDVFGDVSLIIEIRDE